MHRIAVIPALVLLATAAVAADLPPLNNSTLTADFTGTVSVCMVPGGGGTPLTEAFDLQGHPVDATLTLTVYDWNNDPVMGYPAEDMWLECDDIGPAPCGPWGALALADGPTDAAGRTTFTGALNGGGHSPEGARIRAYLNGDPIIYDSMDIRVNSPDMDGNLAVDLTDVVLFSQVYFSGTNDYAADFWADGVVNLTDIVIFSRHYGAGCD